MNIKANTNFNDYTKTAYSTTFTIEEELPCIGDYYDDMEVVDVKPVDLDVQQPNGDVYNYSYYEVIVEDDEEERFHYPVACYDIKEIVVKRFPSNIEIFLYKNEPCLCHEHPCENLTILTSADDMLKYDDLDEALSDIQSLIVEHGKVDQSILDDAMLSVKIAIDHMF